MNHRTAPHPPRLTPYAHWSPATDTRELPSHRRGTPRGSTAPIRVIVGEVVEPAPETVEVGFPWAKPAPARTRRTWARRWARFRRSRFAGDLAAVAAAVWLVLALRGAWTAAELFGLVP